jgi:hypothetical protein
LPKFLLARLQYRDAGTRLLLRASELGDAFLERRQVLREL